MTLLTYYLGIIRVSCRLTSLTSFLSKHMRMKPYCEKRHGRRSYTRTMCLSVIQRQAAEESDDLGS